MSDGNDIDALRKELARLTLDNESMKSLYEQYRAKVMEKETAIEAVKRELEDIDAVQAAKRDALLADRDAVRKLLAATVSTLADVCQALGETDEKLHRKALQVSVFRCFL